MDAVATDAERDDRAAATLPPTSIEASGQSSRLVSPVLAHLEGLHARHAVDRSGVVASYIPELAKADPDWFGICVATVDGAVYEVGDTRRTFTLQSISKPLTYGLALADLGEAAVRERIGVEPTGDAFNAITLSVERGTPLNPMVNAGAIAAAGLVTSPSDRTAFDRIRDVYGRWAGRPLEVDDAVYRSERQTGHRNRAIAHLLRSTGALGDDPDEVVDRYFRQCAIAVDARDLALIGATLAAGGSHPLTHERVAEPSVVRAMLSVMATCGMYDGAGAWLFDIGLPAKSGVSGGIVAVLPGQLGISIYSPPLDPRGNSVRGVAVCRELAKGLDLHMVAEGRSAGAPIRSSSDLVTRRSTRVRSAPEMAHLARVGSDAIVLELHGELTFLAGETVARSVAERKILPGAVLLDLRRVGRIDRGAGPILDGLATALEATGGRLAVAGRDAVLSTLGDDPTVPIARFPDIDAALEWAEERLLRPLHRDGLAPPIELAEHELIDGIEPNAVARLRPYLAARHWAGGDIVVRRGDTADELFLLMAGGATASLEVSGGGRRRLSTVGAGSVLGELAFLGTERRTADVTADSPLEAFVLTRAAFAEIGRRDPALKAALLENLLRIVVRVARRMTDEVAALAG